MQEKSTADVGIHFAPHYLSVQFNMILARNVTLVCTNEVSTNSSNKLLSFNEFVMFKGLIYSCNVFNLFPKQDFYIWMM